MEQQPGDPQPGSADHEENADVVSDADLLSEALGAIIDQAGIDVVASLGVGAGGAGSSVEVARFRPAAAQEAARPLSDVGQALLEPSYWGPFRITPNQPHMCPPHGGFQAQCRWLAKSLKIGCKNGALPAQQAPSSPGTTIMLQTTTQQSATLSEDAE